MRRVKIKHTQKILATYVTNNLIESAFKVKSNNPIQKWAKYLKKKL